jgi:hypothetical protein
MRTARMESALIALYHPTTVPTATSLVDSGYERQITAAQVSRGSRPPPESEGA